MIPTQIELAALAAVMATPAEDPEITARRAMLLWDACGKEVAPLVQKEARINELLSEPPSEDSINDYLFIQNFMPSETVSLDSFLEACMPESKEDTRTTRWRAYRRFYVARADSSCGLPVKDDEALRDAVASMMKRDRDEGFPCSNALLTIRDDFRMFCESTVKPAIVENARKMTIIRTIIRPASKALLDGQRLTAEQKETLKNLTPQEIETEIKGLKMSLEEADKWKAAIVDLRTSQKGRPRKIPFTEHKTPLKPRLA